MKQKFTAIVTQVGDTHRVVIKDEQDDTHRAYEAEREMFDKNLLTVLHETIKYKVYFSLSGDTKTECPDCLGGWYKVRDDHSMVVCKNPECVASHQRYFDWWGTRVFNNVVDLQITDLRTP